LVAVGATYFVQTEVITTDVWLIGSGIGALAANILVVNNYRDAETDVSAGKRTLVVRFGRRFARAQFVAAHALGVAVIFAIGIDDWNPFVLACAVAICVAIGWLQSRLLARATTPAELIRLLGATGMYLAGYALMVSIGLIWG